MTPRSSGRKIGCSCAAASQVPEALTQSTSPSLTELLPPAPCTRSMSRPMRADTSISSAGGVVLVIIVLLSLISPLPRCGRGAHTPFFTDWVVQPCFPLPSEQRHHPIGLGREVAIELGELGVALAGTEAAGDEHRRQPGAPAAGDVVLDAVADSDAAIVRRRAKQLEAMAIDLRVWLADEAHLAAALLIAASHLPGAERRARRRHGLHVGIGADQGKAACQPRLDRRLVVGEGLFRRVDAGQQDE